MTELLKWLGDHAFITSVLAFCIAAPIGATVFLFIHAYFNGRDISFWPPKIGSGRNSSKIESSTQQHRDQMAAIVGGITESARNEILMYCGTMSFIESDYKCFANLQRRRIKVRALCINSRSAEVRKRFTTARRLGIEVKYYSNELDPGVRARICDPSNFEYAVAVYISKEAHQDEGINYNTRVIDSRGSATELNLLVKLFDALWASAYDEA